MRQLVTNGNLRKAIQHKVIQRPAANTLLAETIAHLKAQIKALEEEIRRLIRQDPSLSELLTLLVSIPSKFPCFCSGRSSCGSPLKSQQQGAFDVAVTPFYGPLDCANPPEYPTKPPFLSTSQTLPRSPPPNDARE